MLSRILVWVVFGVFILFLGPSIQVIYADYLLPYPSFMPGHPIYAITKQFDEVNRYWYWGNIAKIKYILKFSDKNLVESKTLFEYKQLLLASEALERSNKLLGKLPVHIAQAQSEGKDINNLKNTIFEAMTVHIQVLEKLALEVPSEFDWTPEKAEPKKLFIREQINSSILIREEIINNLSFQ